MKYTIADEFATTPERYWEVFFDGEYNKQLFAHLRVGYELIEMKREGEGEALVIRRRQKLAPQREMPAIFQKFVKGGAYYVEENRFTARTHSMEVVTTPSFMADSIVTRGVYRLEVAGPRAVRRVWDGEVTVKIPLIGGKAESFIVDEVKSSYRATTEFTRRWLADHP